MHALIVYAHHEPRSMNGALKDAAVEVFGQHGWSVEVSDLYAMNFRADASRDDFTSLRSPEYFGYAHEQRWAIAGRGFSPDILQEQDKLVRADLVIFQFPVWWYSVPAIMKGWVDRVLAHGFAFDDEHVFETGLLRGRRAMISMTTGGTEQELIDDSPHTGTPTEFMRHFSAGVLEFVGFEVCPQFTAYAVRAVGASGREEQLARFRSHLVEVIATKR